MKSPFNAIEETRIAKEMLSRGATRGMVDVHLQREGMREHLREEVIAAASASINRRAQMIAILTVPFGLFWIAVGGGLLVWCIKNGWPAKKLTIVMMMVGLLIVIYGLYGITQKRV